MTILPTKVEVLLPDYINKDNLQDTTIKITDEIKRMTPTLMMIDFKYVKSSLSDHKLIAQMILDIKACAIKHEKTIVTTNILPEIDKDVRDCYVTLPTK